MMSDRFRMLITRVAVALLQAVISVCPDRVLGMAFLGIARLVYAVTGDRQAQVPVMDMADIFLSGPPHTTRVRKFIANIEPDIVASTLRCLFRPSPYGAA